VLTYQVRKRIFRLDEKDELAFPTEVIIVFVLGPVQPFGVGQDQGKTCVKGVAAKALFNANTGHHSIASEEPLSPLDVIINDEIRKVKIEGNIVKVSQNIESLNELNSLIQSIYFSLPMLLNIEFVDPPYVEQVKGSIGGLDFRWELEDWSMSFETTTQETQEKKACDSWCYHYILSEKGGRRLLAAVHYLHVACRLARAGNSPWEFMSEVLLNYCKILEVLFPSKGESKTMEAAREELMKLGFEKTEIEKYYIPAIALRNKIDVAHVDLAIFSPKQLKTLHSYTEISETKFRELLRRIFTEIEKGTYSIPEYTDLTPRQEAINTIDALARQLEI